MVDRPNKPSALSSTPGLAPQAQVSISHGNSRVAAVLPTGESVEVMLYGATVVSWKAKGGAEERLWLSEAAKLDGSKAIRGGIPLVFPVFGTAPDHPATGKLPQHGFARTSTWDFLGKSTSESAASEAGGGAGSSKGGGGGSGDLSVKLDFGLSSSSLDAATRALWPYDFGLIYSVTLERDALTTSLVISNEGSEPFECQVLMHTYLRVNDITKVEVGGLDAATYIDKVDGAKTKDQAGVVTISSETDRVYTPAGPPQAPITVSEGPRKLFEVARDNLGDVVVWNPWADKAAAMADFAPKDGFRRMLCIEAGAVRGWQTVEPGDALEGAQTITTF